jgi:hypothetical protein
MGINQSGAFNRAIADNNFEEALTRSEKMARYQPLDATQHLRVGFVAYLAGKLDRSIAAFERAKQLTLPAQFKTAWEEQSARVPVYKKVLDDKAFVTKVFAPVTSPQP